jgi:dienelactone hydrolase
VFAHGVATVPDTYVELLSRWASAGYVVVAPAIPLLNGDAPGGASHDDYGPANIADLGFTLDEALRRAATSTDPHFALFALVDSTKVAVAGQSDGEVLAYALAFESCCHDPRVGAAVLLAGNLDNARALPAATGVPVLHVMADLDEYNPYPKAIEFDRAHLVAPSYSLTLRSAHHAPPFADPADPHFDVVARVSVDFLDMALKGAAGGPGRLQSDVDAVPDLATLEARSGSPAGP